MSNLERATFKILLDKNQNGSIMSFHGKVDERNSNEVLLEYFNSVIPEISGKLTVDISTLEFMNSSAINALVVISKKLEDHQIDTKFIFRKDSFWQAAAFKAINTLVTMFKHISLEGK